MFKVETQFSYGWDDAGWREDETSLVTFATREAAQAEIDDLCKRMNAQLGPDRRAEYYDPKDYRVVPVNIAEGHVPTIYQASNGEFNWECSCGDNPPEWASWDHVITVGQAWGTHISIATGVQT